MAEGRSLLSSISSALVPKRSHSLGNSLHGDGWAVSATLVTILAEGWPTVASRRSSHVLQPPGFVPLRRPCYSVAAVVCHGNFVVPSGVVPGDGEVDPEFVGGPYRISETFLEVLLVTFGGPKCNSDYMLGPDVICYVLCVTY